MKNMKEIELCKPKTFSSGKDTITKVKKYFGKKIFNSYFCIYSMYLHFYLKYKRINMINHKKINNPIKNLAKSTQKDGQYYLQGSTSH
jgi:hypothetical protein